MQLPPDDGSVTRVLDIGCGPGNSTAVLRERYPHAKILGVDSSPVMIETARKTYPDIDFQLCDVSARLDELPALPTFLLPRDSVEARRIRVLGGATCFPRRQLWVDLATGLAVMPLAAALFPIAMAFAYAARCGGAVLRRQSARSRWGWS